MIIASHMINSDWKELLEGLHPLLVYSIAEIWWVWINESTTQDDITSIVPLYDATCSQYSVPSSTNRGGCTRASNFVPKNGTYESTALVSNNDVSLSDVPMPPLLPCSVLYYTDEWSRLHKSFKILWTADGPAASSLFCCWGIAPHESTVLFSTSAAAAIALFRLVSQTRVGCPRASRYFGLLRPCRF